MIASMIFGAAHVESITVGTNESKFQRVIRQIKVLESEITEGYCLHGA